MSCSHHKGCSPYTSRPVPSAAIWENVSCGSAETLVGFFNSFPPTGCRARSKRNSFLSFLQMFYSDSDPLPPRYFWPCCSVTSLRSNIHCTSLATEWKCCCFSYIFFICIMQFANVARCFGLLVLFLTAMKHHFYSFTLLTGEMTVKDLSLDNGILKKKKKN